MRKSLIATLAFALVGLAGSANAQTVVSGNITTNTTWSGQIVLGGAVFVKSGATLTILPGTIVRGQPRTGPVVAGSTVGTPGALIVTQTGRVVAAGTSTNPIIFTTAAVDNNNDGVADDVSPADGFDDAWTSGDTFLDDSPLTAPLAPLDTAGNANVSKWGGVVILGNAPTNLADACGTPYGTCTIEGLTIPGFPVTDATYGGLNPHDNSGRLEFVSIRHGGDEIGNGNELNCLSMGGVGDATVISHVECYANFDDGFEAFGGTVDADHLVAAMIGDDSFDIDQGFTGVWQFLFGVMPFFNENGGGAFGSASGDKAGELDGDDRAEPGANVNIRLRFASASTSQRAWPLQFGDFWNATIIGSTPDAGQCFTPASPASANRGFQVRNGYAGRIFNSIVVNTGTAQGYDVDTTAGTGVTDTSAHVTAGLVALVSSTLDDGAALPGGAGSEQAAVANGDALNATLGGTANVVNNALFQGLVDEDSTFDPTGNAAGKLTACGPPMDPRPAFGLVGLGSGPAPTGRGLDSSATYRGAFLRTAPTLWTTGWTVLNRAGLLAN